MAQDFSPVAGSLLPGDQVASYRVEEQIGRGGMAVVYRALDLRLGRQVALKVLAPHLGADEAFRQRFIRESRAAAGVDHPHIIPVFEAGEEGDLLFIAMRYVSGGDVRELIQADGTLGIGRTASITAQVASALDAAHAHGLVHRDVKPGNMLLGETGATGTDHVYLSDFGLSKHSLAASTLTGTGQFMGTLDYVSPEQIQGQPADGRADQYALACTVVEMLTGSPPFRRDETMALLWEQLEAAPPRLTERRPDLPAAVDGVIRTALAKRPGDRYVSCLAFASALRAACDVRHPARPAAAGLGVAATTWPPQAAPLRPPPAGETAQTLVEPVPIPVVREPKAAAPVPAQHPPTQQAVVAPPPARRNEARQPAGRQRLDRPAAQRPPGHVARPVQDHLYPQRPVRRRRKRGRLVAGVLAIVLIAGLGVLGYKLFYKPAKSSPPVTYVTVPPRVTTPEQTVEAYFAAINAGDYRKAWDLVGKTKSYQAFAKGFTGTKHDKLTIESVSGNVVRAKLAAQQTDGATQYYAGSYTVTNGIISGSDVQCTSGCPAS